MGPHVATDYEQVLLKSENDNRCIMNTTPPTSTEQQNHLPFAMDVCHQSISISTANDSSSPSEASSHCMHDNFHTSSSPTQASTAARREKTPIKQQPLPQTVILHKKKPSSNRYQKTFTSIAKNGQTRLHWPPKNTNRFQSQFQIGSSSSSPNTLSTVPQTPSPYLLGRVTGVQLKDTISASRPEATANIAPRQLALPQVRPSIAKSVQKKKHKCLECGKIFKRAHNLKIHDRLHTGERPFCCKMSGCGRTFRWKSSIVSHMKWHGKSGGSTPIATPSRDRNQRTIARTVPTTPPPARMVDTPASASSTASASMAMDSFCSEMEPLVSFSSLMIGDSTREEMHSPTELVRVGDIGRDMGQLTPIFPGYAGYDHNTATSDTPYSDVRDDIPCVLRNDENLENNASGSNEDDGFHQTGGFLHREAPSMSIHGLSCEDMDDDQEMSGDPFRYLDSDEPI